jgi:glycosyltransferase involved in cell wall biosynthesis
MIEPEISPLVSIGMPVYNGEKTIQQALDSLLAQDFEDFELIISDNASTDSTGNICQLYAARDIRIRYCRNEKNIGPTANFNRLIHIARGKYFMWAADDDLWESSFVSCMVDALDSNPDAVLSFCNFDYLFPDKKPLTDRDNWSKVIGRDKFYRLLHSCSLGSRVANSCYIYGLIRKEILLKCGGMETRVDVYAGADIVTLFHLLCYGQFIKVDRLLYHKRYNFDRLFKLPLAQRLAKQSLYSLIRSYLKWLDKMHGHYHILRVIVKEKTQKATHKVLLFTTLYTAETFFYFENLSKTLLYSIYDYLKAFISTHQSSQ